MHCILAKIRLKHGKMCVYYDEQADIVAKAVGAYF